jgi:hypothetical protein
MPYIHMIYIFPVLMVIIFAMASFNMAGAADDGFGPRFGTVSASAFDDPASPNLMASSPDAPMSAFDDPNFDPSSLATIEPAAGGDEGNEAEAGIDTPAEPQNTAPKNTVGE